MELEEIKKIIREAAHKQISDLQQKSRLVPQNFNEFRWIFSKALEQTNFPQHVIQEAYEDEINDSQIFESMYVAWAHIQQELKGIKDPKEKLHAWNQIKDFYINEAMNHLSSMY